MYCEVETGTVVGTEAVPVRLQVHIASGLPGMRVVGMPDALVQESKDRVRSALKSSGFSLPASRITVNLAPAELRKHGSGFDLPMAVGILCASRQLPLASVAGGVVYGELHLDGSAVEPVGAVPVAAMAAARGLPFVTGLGSSPLHLTGQVPVRLRRLRDLADGGTQLDVPPKPNGDRQLVRPPVDFAEVIGQGDSVRALLIAVAGDHHMLMIGPPGVGKTMIASRIPTIMPPLTEAEQLDVATVYSVARDVRHPPDGIRPFRAPHHSASAVGMIGGGNPPHPGEVSLAHHGVLFLDELGEFGPAVIQGLRTPLEEGAVRIVRSAVCVSMPAQFMLIAASNPCPCGYAGDADVPCRCSQSALDRYAARLSGPILDRIDIVARLSRPNETVGAPAPSSDVLQSAVMQAKGVLSSRSLAPSGVPDTEVHSSSVAHGKWRYARDEASSTLSRSAGSIPLSMRGIYQVRRLAETVAAIEGRDIVCADDVREALTYRNVAAR